jgi:hypothetical protein
MRSIRTPSSLLALLVAACYLGLAVLGAVCLFGDMSGGSSVPHHADHAGKTAHSPLCAWACQAGPSAILVGFGGVSLALYVLFWSTAPSIAFFSRTFCAFARPRAPPVVRL